MKVSLYVSVLIAALAMVSILSYAVLAQSNAAYDRTLCIQNCESLKPLGGRYDSDEYRNQYQDWTNCMSSCEIRFWQEFDRERGEPEQELK